MATDASNVNGVYDQYQPAELAASTPSQSAAASQTSNTASSTKADPQEIGWYFVEQYYTNLSKSPEKIHLFYNKKSQLIVGKEAEKVLPAVGTKAIHEKIKSIEFSDCKIRVLNVDSQASYDNIVVQVIGEMSNKSEPHHKFVQTFVLATQPNGYFVLNDICRFLSEDVDEIVEDEPAQEEPVVEEKQEPVPEPEAVTEPPPVEENTVTTQEAADQVDDKLEAAIEEPQAEPEGVNGKAEDEDEEEEEAATADTTTSEIVESEPAVSEAAPQESEKPAAPEPTPAQTPPQQAPADDGPPVKKTWASMLATTKAPAIPALPQTTAPAAASSTQSKPQRPTTTTTVPKAVPTEPAADTAASGTPTSQQSNGWQEAGAGKKTKTQQSKAQEGIVHAYIKNVNDKIDARVLREVLEKYGTLKYYDVSRPKQCAFVEFNDPAAYTAAVADNPHTVGTEQINVEERRPRPGTTGTYSGQYANRGGATAGRGRGGTQQRSGSQSGGFPRDATRGNFQQRGNKTGTATRGRGQSQAA